MSAPDLKAPPAKPGYWCFKRVKRRKAGPNKWTFQDKTWFEARAKACAFFGCEPSDVVCVGRPV